MTAAATALGTAICTAMIGSGAPAATLAKHIAWAQAFLDNYAGAAVLIGTAVPDPSLGANGDLYFRIDAGIVNLYGPKTAGAWGAERLGDSVTKSVGTAAGTVAAGDHTHAHNDTTSKQGGITGEYYHLTSAQVTKLDNSDKTAIAMAIALG